MPTRKTVLQALNEHSEDARAFLATYSSGRHPRTHYLLHNGRLYPLKAIWAASHRPRIHTRAFQTDAARRGLFRLNFKHFMQGELAKQNEEGERIARERFILSRNAKLVEEAKARYGFCCTGCGFNFQREYGELGKGYIECHHLDPLSGREGKNAPTKIEELTVLCSNCHRMVHRRVPALTIRELRDVLKRTRRER